MTRNSEYLTLYWSSSNIITSNDEQRYIAWMEMNLDRVEWIYETQFGAHVNDANWCPILLVDRGEGGQYFKNIKLDIHPDVSNKVFNAWVTKLSEYTRHRTTLCYNTGEYVAILMSLVGIYSISAVCT